METQNILCITSSNYVYFVYATENISYTNLNLCIPHTHTHIQALHPANTDDIFRHPPIPGQNFMSPPPFLDKMCCPPIFGGVYRGGAQSRIPLFSPAFWNSNPAYQQKNISNPPYLTALPKLQIPHTKKFNAKILHTKKI